MRNAFANYSATIRVGTFIIPGPAFMYILALGDVVFRRLLHLCPEPMNSAFLTLLLLNVALLFLSIRIFARYCKSSLFLPVAVFLSLWLIYVINRTHGPVATMNIWLPHMILYVFLLFVTVCASVATGAVADLPILIVCGGLLVHGHVAQLSFVGVLSVCSFLSVYLLFIRKNGLRAFGRANSKTLVVSGILLAVFLAPILLDLAIHHPNNVQKIRTYLSEHKGERNPISTAVKYETSFFTFTPDPEVVIPNPAGAHLVATAAPKLYVLRFWMMGIFLAGVAVASRRKAASALPPFLIYIGFEVILVSGLFLYWAARITGPLYNFNGFFYYSIQFVILFTLAAIALDGLALQASNTASTVLACAIPLTMFTSSVSFNRVGLKCVGYSDPEVESITESVPPAQHSLIRIRFPEEGMDWVTASGVASRLHWMNRAVCVDDKWGLMFEDRDVCRHVEGLVDLTLTHAARPCESPCQSLLHDKLWYAELAPFPAEKLPFTIGPLGNNSLNFNFYDPENTPTGPMWSKRQSSMRFLLDPQWTTAPSVRIEIKGLALPDRPVQVELNGRTVGTISGSGPIDSAFVVSRDLFRSGHENELSFQVDKAGPVNTDLRQLGFKLSSIQFQAADENTAAR